MNVVKFLVAGLAAAVAAGVAPVAAQAAPAIPASVAVLAAPASPADLDFVRRVHLTALSVGPACTMAQGNSADTGVKGLARKVGTQDSALDTLAVSSAKALKVALTGSPAASGLTQLRAMTGGVFDTTYINYLWTQDSTLLPIATAIRATTGNATVRKLAAQAGELMAAQLPLLQKSGSLQLPAVAAPAASATAAQTLPGGATLNPKLMSEAQTGDGFLSTTVPMRLLVLAAALTVVGVLYWRLRVRSPLGPRRRRRSR